MATVLAVGGAGYIGSHTTAALIEKGYDVVVIDDLSNSSQSVLQGIGEICGKTPQFIHADMRDTKTINNAINGIKIDFAILLAGVKSVPSSIANPIDYYSINVGGAADIMSCLRHNGIFDVVFSSSATVYSESASQPVAEDSPLGAINPYGETKLAIERMLDWTAASDPRWRIISLRYFNPVGAHPTGKIGENPRQPPTNLFPLIGQAALGQRDALEVYGGDYPTPDGSGVRDFIHVVDLAEAHVAAVEAMAGIATGRNTKINVGTGAGISVLEVLHLWGDVVGRTIPHRVVARREGDLAVCLADPDRARGLLGWKARFSHRDMCRDHWNFQRRHASAQQASA